MTPSDISKILNAIGDLKTDIAVIKEAAKVQDSDRNRIEQLERDNFRTKIALAVLITAFAASGLSALGVPLPLN